MATFGFSSTPLWTMTLAPRPEDPNEEHRDYLRSAFLQTRETTGLLLGELGPSMPDYTVHDVSHADALWETASLLMGEDMTLNPVEGFVLGLAFLLHDAAMGLAAYQRGPSEVLGEDGWRDLLCSVFRDRRGRWPTQEELTEPPADVVTHVRSAAVREAHARQAGVLVETPWISAEGKQYYLLNDARLRDWYGPLLADLVESHWWDVGRVSGHFDEEVGSPPWLPDWPLDPLKLACLLRLADATQIDARRAPTLLLLIRQPEGESARHWRFQQYVNRPQLRGDRIRYTSSRPFPQADAAAWWLALDYLREVDSELRKVDDLLHDLGRARFVGRGVAGVGTPARFAKLFGVRGWRPIDADIQVSDVRGLVASLGGEQLYGRQPETAVRELIQNAHDAVLARRILDVQTVGLIEIALTQLADGGWTLTVTDDGVGMDEDLLVGGLMDFGSSGWRTRKVREEFPGLLGAGFRPRGRFGIGFFAVFMLGDGVEVVSRRYDLGHADARRLVFDGLRTRPLITPLSSRERASAGTTVTVHLKLHPFDRDGLLSETMSGRLDELVQRLVPESAVRMRITDPRGGVSILEPFALDTADAGAVFDRLYPEVRDEDPVMIGFREELRAAFVESATPLQDDAGRRVGLAMVGSLPSRWYGTWFHGVTVVTGFTADRWDFFCGYIEAQPGRASRDQAELAASDPVLGSWYESQQQVLWEAARFDLNQQFEIANILVRAGVSMRPSHHIALIGGGALALAEIEPWVSARDELFVCWGWPLSWGGLGGNSIVVFNVRTGEQVTLPDGWILPIQYGIEAPLDQALDDRRDSAYESARYDWPMSWQRRWWNISDDVLGVLVTILTRTWSCTVEDLLAPPAARLWMDTAVLPGRQGRGDVVGGMWLRKPDRVAGLRSTDF